jgi:SAM-dependent methyltransferase
MIAGMNVLAHNRDAWDLNVERGNPWTVPVGPQAIAAAKEGRWEILLTPTKPVPKSWFPALPGCKVLCLASGGGQQGPILAAAGAKVTVFDNSPKQLEQDRFVAAREGLELATIQGDMADLSAFDAGSFDLIVHPVSNCFVPDLEPVWKEAYRVLRRDGALLAGFVNPVLYIFDEALEEKGILRVEHRLPYSDLDHLSEAQKKRYLEEGRALEFSHTLEEQIGGQLEAGFVIAGFYEDGFPGRAFDAYLSTMIATRAVKL